MMKFGKTPRPYYCSETEVPQGLAVTPTEVAQMTERGVSVSAQNLGLTYVDGSPDPVLLYENKRGVDVNDIWNKSQDSKERLIGAHKKDKEYYG